MDNVLFSDYAKEENQPTFVRWSWEFDQVLNGFDKEKYIDLRIQEIDDLFSEDQIFAINGIVAYSSICKLGYDILSRDPVVKVGELLEEIYDKHLRVIMKSNAPSILFTEEADPNHAGMGPNLLFKNLDTDKMDLEILHKLCIGALYAQFRYFLKQRNKGTEMLFWPAVKKESTSPELKSSNLEWTALTLLLHEEFFRGKLPNAIQIKSIQFSENNTRSVTIGRIENVHREYTGISGHKEEYWPATNRAVAEFLKNCNKLLTFYESKNLQEPTTRAKNKIARLKKAFH